MFWRFGGYSNISTIDTLLDKQNVKLEDLLEEQDLVQELKSHHTKLIEFLRDDKNLHALLKYVVAPGPDRHDEIEGVENEDSNKHNEEQEKAEKKRLKYAYVACEILSCETWSITEALMSNIPNLTEFWDFVRRSPPLDPLQAGYFTKVNETLLEKKTEEMLGFFKSLPNIVPALLQHVDCPMVMDLLLKIISMEKTEGGAGIADWLQAQNLIPCLLSSLSPECNSSTQTSAGDFLKAIITISANAAQNEQSCIGPNSLSRQLVSESCMKSLIAHMLKGGNPLTVGVGIVIEVIRKNNSDYDPDNGQHPDSPPTNHDPIFLGTLLRLFAKNIPNFMELILSTKHTITDGEKTRIVDRGVLKSAWGTKIEPLGFDRFKTCELMAELLHCSNMGLLNEKGSEDYIKARDVERERLRVAGEFSTSKEPEDSTVDVSTTSSKFENTFAASVADSVEEFRIANGGEEDEFEKVSAPNTTDVPEESTAMKTESGELVDEPLSPTKPKPLNIQASSVASLDDNVRRLSIEDTEMTSPDNSDIAVHSSPNVGMSPHPDDKPAPLFTKSTDPSKTPTATSPKALKTPQVTSSGIADTSVHLDDSSIIPEQDDHEVVEDDRPVVGDFLKIMFVDHRVVPTILSFFFRFPWNNFLHNVVYDVVQQVFNGPMDRGHNKYLAFDLFESGKITEQIISGQKRSEDAEKKKSMRLGYMGHLTLVAEEVVKFGERHPKEILSPLVQEFIYGKPWEDYVTKTLAETRDRDNAILGGFRPENGIGSRQAVLNAVNANSGFGGSQALANVGLTSGQQGLDSVDLSNNGSTTSAAGYTSGGSLLSGFGSSSDDDDEEMDEEDEAQQRTIVQLSAADTGVSGESDQPTPLIPPPPAPLNIEPSRARRKLAERLANNKQQQEQEATASEFGMEDDPFAALGDNDDQDAEDQFSLDEEEQDITSFGKRSNAPSSDQNGNASFSISKGINNLFSSNSSRRRQGTDSFKESLDDSSSSDTGSDGETDRPPLEARTSLERRPLDIEDDDDEMGEMVAPTDEPNSSDEEAEEALTERERRRLGLGMSQDDDSNSEFDGQADEDHDDDSDVVEIAMPSRRRSHGSTG